MRGYIIRRLLLIIPTLWLASLIVFFMLRLMPGDVVDLMAGEQGQVAGLDREAIMKVLGLDQPMHIQYGRWLGVLPTPDRGFNGILQGSLGESLWTKMPVAEEIIRRVPVTLELGVLALTVAMTIALPVGVYSAIRQDTGGDYLGRSFAIACIAVPGFWLGTMIMVFPSLWWNWSPEILLIHFIEDPLGNLQMFIVPAVVMGMNMSGTAMRMTRTMMLEVLRQDYIRTAWSKGLKERVIVLRHALRNALIPVVTIVGLALPVLIGGAVIIEQIFALPGMGRLMLDAISNRDYPIVIGVMLFMATFVVTVNLIVDLTYAFLDPRVHYG